MKPLGYVIHKLGNTEGSRRNRMTEIRKQIIYAMLLGDSYIQPTGKLNARLRFEHSINQFDYLMWKAKFFREKFLGAPKILSRFNPKFGKTYEYVRWQSSSCLEFGEARKVFYEANKKIIPANIDSLITSPLALAIWFMDDGYLYRKDKLAYIYLPKVTDIQQMLLLKMLKHNFQLLPVVKTKKFNSFLFFNVVETKRLLSLIRPFVPSCMSYKVSFDPVSTDPLLEK